jgi:hypothetical protein
MTCPYCKTSHSENDTRLVERILIDFKDQEYKNNDLQGMQDQLGFNPEDLYDQARLLAALGASHHTLSGVIALIKREESDFDYLPHELLILLTECVCLARLNDKRELARSIGCCIADLILRNLAALENGSDVIDLRKTLQQEHAFHTGECRTMGTKVIMINRTTLEERKPFTVHSNIIYLIFSEFDYHMDCFNMFPNGDCCEGAENPLISFRCRNHDGFIIEKYLKEFEVRDKQKLEIIEGLEKKLKEDFQAFKDDERHEKEEQPLRNLAEQAYVGHELENQFHICHQFWERPILCFNIITFFFPGGKEMYQQRIETEKKTKYQIPMDLGFVLRKDDSGLNAELTALEFFLQVAVGILCLHQYGIVHRDIKLGNIVYDEVEQICIYKLIDFDLSVLCKQMDQQVQIIESVQWHKDPLDGLELNFGRESGRYISIEYTDWGSRSFVLSANKWLDVVAYLKLMKSKVQTCDQLKCISKEEAEEAAHSAQADAEEQRAESTYDFVRTPFQDIVQELLSRFPAGSYPQSLKFLTVTGVLTVFADRIRPICQCCRNQ